ncbi:hypothetical protein ACIBSW_23755 [Actinoplanes sp. NPDC049668]|uniref:hypothetical protein n=1 Tax=unclassified Actinoplanes TaxID=2626549 RepID=UPI0033A0C13F
MKREIVAGSVLAVALGVGGWASTNTDGSDGASTMPMVVGADVPEAELVQGALFIELDQDAVLVPAARPAGLKQMGTAGTADGAHVVYFWPKTTGVEVFALFDDEPVAMCAGGENDVDDDSGLLCVRNGKVGDRHVAIYFSADGDTAEYSTAAVEKMREFWATTPLVAPSAAPWFTELTARGHAAEG